jgi:nitroreductase
VPLALSTDELLTTTRTVRRRLDFERPVERKVIEECLALALQAPSGMNYQRWHWVFVTEAVTKAAIAEIYLNAFNKFYGPDVIAAMNDSERRILGSTQYLAENVRRAPVLLIPCQWRRVDGAGTFAQAGFWGSLLPAVWSFQLALRSRGLGSAWTTMHLDREEEVAELIGIPYQRCTQAGLFPIAYTIGTDFKPAPRKDLDSVVHWERW